MEMLKVLAHTANSNNPSPLNYGREKLHMPAIDTGLTKKHCRTGFQNELADSFNNLLSLLTYS